MLTFDTISNSLGLLIRGIVPLRSVVAMVYRPTGFLHLQRSNPDLYFPTFPGL